MTDNLDPSTLSRQFSLSGAQALPTRRIRIIGVPLDMGASRRGVDMGPSAMRVAGLEARLEAVGHQVTDGGNIRVEVAETRNSGNKQRPLPNRNCRNLHAHRRSRRRVPSKKAWFPLVLGGDHSLAAGSVSGVAEFYRRRNERIGVIWIDAHSDINTPETSPSGNVHGMPLAALLGLGPEPLGNIYGFSPKVAPENTVLIGVRDIDCRRARQHPPRRRGRGLHHARYRRARHEQR
jgi:arginase